MVLSLMLRFAVFFDIKLTLERQNKKCSLFLGLGNGFFDRMLLIVLSSICTIYALLCSWGLLLQ